MRPFARPYVSSESDTDLATLLLRELQHRSANVLNQANLLLEVAARRSSTAESKAALVDVARSFRALVDANFRLDVPDARHAADAAHEIEAACAALAKSYATLRPGIRFDCVVAKSPTWSVAPAGALSLMVSELVTNAYKHAFRGRDTGYLLVTLGAAPRGRAFLSVVDDGPGLGDVSNTCGSGLAIVAALARAVGGELSLSANDPLAGRVHVTFGSVVTDIEGPVRAKAGAHLQSVP